MRNVGRSMSNIACRVIHVTRCFSWCMQCAFASLVTKQLQASRCGEQLAMVGLANAHVTTARCDGQASCVCRVRIHDIDQSSDRAIAALEFVND